MSQPAHAPDLPVIDLETPFDRAAAEAVVARAFGPGRFAKTAERLREGAAPALSLVARDGGRVVGSVRLWPIVIGETSALFLGPIAVEAAHRRGGLGARLVEAALAQMDAGGAGVLLVGDMGFFGRLGFAPAAEPTLPGPVDRRRVLWRGRDDGAAPEGLVRAA